jgi:putative SOS response-associated peptidase YedK
MCGRYTLTADGGQLTEIFQVSEAVELSPRYNIAPTQEVAVVGLNQEGGRTLGTMRWGLVPFWAKDPSIGNRMINARSETAAEKPAFRASFKKRRCLVAADGFYEWKRQKNAKQPFYIRLKDHQPFAIAGLWDRWKNKETEETLHSCTLLTVGPNALMEDIHNRMPVILHPEDYDRWLDPELNDREELEAMLRPFEAEAMEAYPVSTVVNNARNDRPECIEPLESL